MPSKKTVSITDEKVDNTEVPEETSEVEATEEVEDQDDEEETSEVEEETKKDKKAKKEKPAEATKKKREGSKERNGEVEYVNGKIPVLCIQNYSAFDKGTKYCVSERVFNKYPQLFEVISSEEYEAKDQDTSKIMKKGK